MLVVYYVPSTFANATAAACKYIFSNVCWLFIMFHPHLQMPSLQANTYSIMCVGCLLCNFHICKYHRCKYKYIFNNVCLFFIMYHPHLKMPPLPHANTYSIMCVGCLLCTIHICKCHCCHMQIHIK